MIGRRLGELGGRLRPRRPAHWVLLGLVVAGVAIRVVGLVSWSPAVTALADSYPYAYYAETTPLDNPQHPAGYSWLLVMIGAISRDAAFTVALQHLLGIATALLLYAAVVRMTDSRPAALLTAAVALLSGDLVFLEHAIMAEGPFTFVLALSFYAAARAIDSPSPWWGWPLATGVLIAVAAVIRSAGLFLAPVVAVTLLLSVPRPWRARLIAPAAVVGAVAVLLVAYASASKAVNGRFEVSPTQGWHLYARVAPFADCTEFDPPPGTAALCESKPPEQRFGLDYYLYDERSPGRRRFGTLVGDGNDDVGAFAREAILHQPGDYLSTVWTDLRGYYVPGSYPFRYGQGGEIEGQVDWGLGLPPVPAAHEAGRRQTERGMELFFDPISVEIDSAGVEFLDTEQRLTRFGATALAITTVLTLIGLAVGPRRNRVAVLLFGVGALTLLVAPTISVYYNGRYAVPLAAPMVAAAAIALLSGWRAWTERRSKAR